MIGFLKYKRIIVSLVLTYSIPCNAQLPNNILAGSKWKIEKLSSLKPHPVSLKLKEEYKGVIISFGKDSAFITKINGDGNEKILKAGPYRITADAKQLLLGNDSAVNLVMNDFKLIVRTPDSSTLYMNKIVIR